MNRNGTSYGGVFESYQERKVLDRLAKIGDEQSYYRKIPELHVVLSSPYPFSST